MESTCHPAEISIRRLLNRIHNSLYPRKQTAQTLSSTGLTTSDYFSAREISSLQLFVMSFTGSSICDMSQFQSRSDLALGQNRHQMTEKACYG
jgi:hypothetical protein